LETPSSSTHKIFQAVQAVFFFGAPHRGMRVDDLAEMAEELSADHGMSIVDYLREHSGQLAKDLSSFITLAADVQIVSFYETLMSQKLQKAKVNDIYHLSSCVF
jgi:hypothetical protein